MKEDKKVRKTTQEIPAQNTRKRVWIHVRRVLAMSFLIYWQIFCIYNLASSLLASQDYLRNQYSSPVFDPYVQFM